MPSGKENLLKYYSRQTPDSIRIEDDDGTYYPKKIPVPAIEFVPLAEPHVIITDLYDAPQDWYHIREYIEEFADQSFAAYYNGLYFASYTLSTSCLELTLKYELSRNKMINSSELEKTHCTFSWAINQITKLGLEKYKDRLDIVNNLRNGMFHFNPKKLNESLILIQNKIIPPDTKIYVAGGGILEESQSSDFPWSISEYSNNENWSKVAYFTYRLMYDITKQLYGKAKVVKYLKEGRADYARKKTNEEKGSKSS